MKRVLSVQQKVLENKRLICTHPLCPGAVPAGTTFQGRLAWSSEHLVQGCSLALVSTIAVTRAVSCHVNSQLPLPLLPSPWEPLHSAQMLTDTPR